MFIGKLIRGSIPTAFIISGLRGSIDDQEILSQVSHSPEYKNLNLRCYPDLSYLDKVLSNSLNPNHDV